MQQVNKAFIYKVLNELSHNGVDTSASRALMLGKEEVPYEVITFVNKHRPIDKLRTYNEIFAKRRKSPLFRNLMKEDLDVTEKSIILSSLLTQSLIGAKHALQSDADELIDALNVDLLMNALYKYINDHDEEAIEDAFSLYQHIFKTLFPK